MSNVLDDDSDDVAPGDHRKRDPSKTISSLSWAEWKGAMSAKVKSLEKAQSDHERETAENFDCVEKRLEQGDEKFTEIQKTLSGYGAGILVAAFVIETTLIVGGVLASAGYFSRPAEAAATATKAP